MSDAPSLDKTTIRTGRIIDTDTVVLLLEFPDLAERDIPHTLVAIWRRTDGWVKRRIDYNAINVSRVPGQPGSSPRFVVIGATGKYTALIDGPSVSGVIVEEDALASADVVLGSILAVGITGGVYQMTSPDAWRMLGNPTVKTNLEAVCEHPAGGFLTCGWEGLVAHYEGRNVEQLETGTNIILTDLICDPDGVITACGQNGTIVRGSKNSLKPLELDGVSEDFWSIARFQGKVYVASTIALYELVDDKTLKLFKFEDEEIPTSFYHLDTFEDSLLLSVGQKDAVLFDGNEWIRIL